MHVSYGVDNQTTVLKTQRVINTDKSKSGVDIANSTAFWNPLPTSHMRHAISQQQQKKVWWKNFPSELRVPCVTCHFPSSANRGNKSQSPRFPSPPVLDCHSCPTRVYLQSIVTRLKKKRDKTNNIAMLPPANDRSKSLPVHVCYTLQRGGYTGRWDGTPMSLRPVANFFLVAQQQVCVNVLVGPPQKQRHEKGTPCDRP